MNSMIWLPLLIITPLLASCTNPKSGMCRIKIDSQLIPALQSFFTVDEVSMEKCQSLTDEQFASFCGKYKNDIVPADHAVISLYWKGERLIGSDVVSESSQNKSCPL